MLSLYDSFPRRPWPHQERTAVRIIQEFAHTRSIVGALPTGAGKTLLVAALTKFFGDRNRGVAIYNNRRTLTKQTSDVLNGHDFEFGVRAASMKKQQNLHANVQVASIQTDIRRVIDQDVWKLHDASLVIVDEAHRNMGPKVQELIQRYLAKGARVLGLTGTPIGMSSVYKDIVVGCDNSELLEIGAHVPMRCFSVAEMDVDQIKRVRTGEDGEFSGTQIAKQLWSQQVVGKIYEEWKRLNPFGNPSLAACPGVGEAVWLAEQFLAKGHRVAHIDGNEVIVNGERYTNDSKGEVRNQVLEDAKKGEFDLVSNCEVLQEGFDWKELRHVILARPYGSLANYLQVVGRGIRGCEGKDECILQDHGGNVLRHGLPNDNRDWAELFSMSEKEIASQRKKDVGEKPEKEPIVCPKCGVVRTEGNRCPSCGQASNARVRTIIQQDGTLKEVGPMFKPPKQKDMAPIEVKQLDSVFWRLKNSRGQTPSDAAVQAVYTEMYGSHPGKQIVNQWIQYRENKLAAWKAKQEAKRAARSNQHSEELPWS